MIQVLGNAIALPKPIGLPEIEIVRRSAQCTAEDKESSELWNPHRVLGEPSLEAGVFQECLII